LGHFRPLIFCKNDFVQSLRDWYRWKGLSKPVSITYMITHRRIQVGFGGPDPSLFEEVEVYDQSNLVTTEVWSDANMYFLLNYAVFSP